MEVLLAFIFPVAMFASLWWFIRERDRYRNLIAGQVFRNWILEHIPPIIADDNASAYAKNASLTILRCIYDEKIFDEIRKAKVESNSPAGLRSDLLGPYSEIIRNAVRHAAVLVVLSSPKMGRAMRELLNESPPEIDAIRKLDAKSGELGRMKPTKEPEWASGAVDGFAKFEKGKNVMLMLEHGIAANCPA